MAKELKRLPTVDTVVSLFRTCVGGFDTSFGSGPPSTAAVRAACTADIGLTFQAGISILSLSTTPHRRTAFSFHKPVTYSPWGRSAEMERTRSRLGDRSSYLGCITSARGKPGLLRKHNILHSTADAILPREGRDQ
jgi:hypothetical protein